MKNVLAMLLIAGLVPTLAMAQQAKKRAATASDSASDDSASSNRRGAVAGEPDSDSCGLGWQVTNKKTMIATTTRGTTNAVVPPTFGMTSGTMGCAQHSFAKKEQPAVIYVVSNFEPLTMQMAEGSGEYLSGLARTMGCSDASHGAFNRAMQSNFKTIVNGKTGPIELFQNVKEQIRANPALAVDCNA